LELFPRFKFRATELYANIFFSKVFFMELFTAICYYLLRKLRRIFASIWAKLKTV